MAAIAQHDRLREKADLDLEGRAIVNLSLVQGASFSLEYTRVEPRWFQGVQK